MKQILFFLVISFSKLIAQDTLLLKNDSKKIVDIIDRTENEVIFKNVNDKKERSYIMPFSQIERIYLRDGKILKTDSMYYAANGIKYEGAKTDSILKEHLEGKYRVIDTGMYKRGVADATHYYGFYEFLSKKKPTYSSLIGGGMLAPGGSYVQANKPELSSMPTVFGIDFPFPELAKDPDYVAGYAYKVNKRNNKYKIVIVGGAVIIVSMFVLFLNYG